MSSPEPRSAKERGTESGRRPEDAPTASPCIVCLELGRVSRAYLSELSKGSPADPTAWESVRRAWGLCRQHTRELLSESSRATEELYRWLAGELLAKLAWDGSSGTSSLRQRAFRALLKPHGMCPACDVISGHQRATVRAIVESLSTTQARAEYLTGGGLCLPHLRLALGVVEEPSAADCMIAHFLRVVDGFATGPAEHSIGGMERLTGYLRRGGSGR